MALEAEIITVGDELLTGGRVNTNAAVLGERLLAAGVDTRWTTVVRDDESEIAGALRRAARRARVVVVTGGLGPTADDRTRKGVARAARSRLVIHEDLLERMRARWSTRGQRMPGINAVQAEIPSKATVIDNRVGTAPGFRLSVAGADVFVVPGVPAEMVGMLEDSILPALEGRRKRVVKRFRTLHTVGWPESRIAERMAERLKPGDAGSVSYLPLPGGVDLRIGVTGAPARVDRMLERAVGRIRGALGEIVYGTDDDRLEQVVGAGLSARGWKIAVAESCTGGLISSLLTDVPGSSAYFERGVVAYGNRAKVSMLGVDPALIRTCGAVSGEVAVAMARGVRRLGRTHIGLSATGIAGPGGGTAAKPVGLVYVGLAAGRRGAAVPYRFPGPRRGVKLRTARAALNLLRLYLENGTVGEPDG